MLWKDHLLAARTKVTIAGGELGAPWLDGVFQLKKQRPEVVIEIIAERSSLGAGEELASQLTAAGVVLHYRTSIVATIGMQPAPTMAGLIMVRDEASVLTVSGAGASGDAIVWGSLLESEPVAREYSARLAQIKSSLPKYPESQLLFNSGM